MNVIDNYNSITPGPLQTVRLYVQGRPLVRYWRQLKRRINVAVPEDIELINSELTTNYVAIDCAGWALNTNRNCIAIETQDISKKLFNNTYIEYDYLDWCPTYLAKSTVLAYYSPEFKYATAEQIYKFISIWGKQHDKLIIGIDPTKLKFNYLKYDFLTELSEHLPDNLKLRVLSKKSTNILFVIER